MSKPTLATVWLDGCTGCHMSLLDMDERLLELADRIELVYSPLVDSVEVLRRGRVRRAKLYYLKGLTGKKARIVERQDKHAAEEAAAE